jgi:Flp pilus assembly protein TadG
MMRLARFRKSISGAAALEFAIVGPVFILLALGIVDIGRNVLIIHQLNHLADQISRRYMLSGPLNAPDLEAYARASWKGWDPASLSVSAEIRQVNGLATIHLELGYPITWVIPLGDGFVTSIHRDFPSR